MSQGVALAFTGQDSSGNRLDPMSFGAEPWPDNTWVKVIITATEPRATKDKQNGRLAITIKAVEGPLAGKIQFIGLNIWHQSDDARRMAERELLSIALSVGKLPFNHTSELHNIPFYVLTSTGPDDQGKTRTNIAGYRDVNGNEPGKGAAPQAGGPQMPAGMPQQAPGAAPAQAPQQFAPNPAGMAPGTQPGFAPQQQQQQQPGFVPQQAPQQGGFAPPAQAQQGGGPAPWGAPGGPAGAPQQAPAPQPPQQGGWAPQGAAPAQGGWTPPAG